MELNDLYRDVILDHNRRPRNFGPMDQADASVEGFNPMCGDRLTLRLRMVDGAIGEIRFEGQGCAISTASASLMTEAVKGKTRAEALQLFERVHELLTDDAAPPAEELGKLAALSGVREYPARVKCASLCWHTLASALKAADMNSVAAVSTE
jgi:nitrogen fixation NifU-like protein